MTLSITNAPVLTPFEEHPAPQVTPIVQYWDDGKGGWSRTPQRTPGMLPNGATLVGSPTVLFDGKTLNADDTDFWQTIGTGTPTFSTPSMTLSVTAGQYLLRQSARHIPYFSGMPQAIEMTYENFTTQANVVKRFGYASRSSVAPYTASMDGVWIEDDGTTKRMRAARLGTSTIDIPMESWANYSRISNYDWTKFTVSQFHFLWLGGAAYEFWMCLPGDGFSLIHSADHVGTNTGTITASPNQPLFYEIRSSTGSGSFTAICSQAFTAGPIEQSGKGIAHVNYTPVACDSTSNIYALLGVKKVASRRDISIKMIDMGCVNTATSDSGLLLLIRKPTLSAPLTYTTSGNLQLGIPGSAITVTQGTGRIIYATPVSSAGASKEFATEFLTWMTTTPADVMDEYVLAFKPTTTNQSVTGVLNMEEYV